MKLIEGSRYTFKVEKKIDLEGNEFWVLSGPDNKRYLLSCSDYSSYNIKESELLDCRIDKINCKGEVFLEPEHPYYREGSVYEFVVRSIETRINKSGENEDLVLLSGGDMTDLAVPVKIFKNMVPEINSRVLLKVNKIVKGNIVIGESGISNISVKDEDSDAHNFVVVGESKGLDGKIYYIIADKNKNQYTIPRDYYSHYGLKEGSSFRGRFLRYKEGHDVTVEPDSPFFKTGKIYDFVVKEVIKLPEGIDDVMVVEDEYGYQHHVKPRKKPLQGQHFEYRVVKMRKGWPLLEEV